MGFPEARRVAMMTAVVGALLDEVGVGLSS
jgi:hypothetical protein